MHSEPRNPQADARFIKAGGLKNWGCSAFAISVFVLLLLLIPIQALLTNFIGEPAALWTSIIFLIAAIAGIVSLLIRTRRKQRLAQEQAWQQAMK